LTGLTTSERDRHGQVKPGIEAPEDVEIWREEIYKKIQSSEPETSHLTPTIFGFSDGDFKPGEAIKAGKEVKLEMIADVGSACCRHWCCRHWDTQ
jgi:hypothetical protein